MATATLRQSGGSVILAIPKAVLDALGLRAESKVRMEMHGRPHTFTPGVAIDDLVAGWSPHNRHDPGIGGERGAERIDD